MTFSLPVPLSMMAFWALFPALSAVFSTQPVNRINAMHIAVAI
jgi:hypothetical protein